MELEHQRTGVGPTRIVVTPRLLWQTHGIYEMLRGKSCEIALMPTPHYSEHGHYIALLEAHGMLELEMDVVGDTWPRYYFDRDRAKEECEAWMRRKGQL